MGGSERLPGRGCAFPHSGIGAASARLGDMAPRPTGVGRPRFRLAVGADPPHPQRVGQPLPPTYPPPNVMTSTQDRPEVFSTPGGQERGRKVRRIFSEIAPRYDLLNHVLSMNVDRGWRRKAVAALGWERNPEGRYLDACAGTFDLSLELARRAGFAGRVVGSDFALPMLVEGLPKLAGAPVLPLCADALRLPFEDASFHGATVGFGVRNLADLDRGLAELG